MSYVKQALISPLATCLAVLRAADGTASPARPPADGSRLVRSVAATALGNSPPLMQPHLRTLTRALMATFTLVLGVYNPYSAGRDAARRPARRHDPSNINWPRRDYRSCSVTLQPVASQLLARVPSTGPCCTTGSA